MWKTGLIALVLLGFAWSYPPTRAPIANAMAPALRVLGPVGDRALLPAQRYDARNEVEFIIEQLQIHRTEGRALPSARNFQQWLKQRVTTKRNGNDPWGRPYYFVRVSGTATVGSDGPDGVRNTADDIKKNTTL